MTSRTATSALAAALMAAVLALALYHLTGPMPGAAPVSAAAGKRPGPAARADPYALTPARRKEAARLAGQILTRLHEVEHQMSIQLNLGEELTRTLTLLDAGQHRLVITTLLGEESLPDSLRAAMGDSLSLAWLQAHDQPGGHAAALATLEPLLVHLREDLRSLLVDSSLDFIARRDPAFAARWFAGHLEIWETATGSGIDTPRAHLMDAMSGHPATALAQLELFAAQDCPAMAAALAKGAVLNSNPLELLAAFQSATRSAPDPAAAAQIHQSLLTGLGQGLSGLRAAGATAWLDQAQLPPTDLQTLLNQLPLPSDPAEMTAWLGWLGEKIPAADLETTLARRAAEDAVNHRYVDISWIPALPEGPLRDAAVHRFAASVTDPILATRLAEALPANHPDRAALLQIREPGEAPSPADSGELPPSASQRLIRLIVPVPPCPPRPPSAISMLPP